ncbi:hypothetical protein J7E88_02595 [Streptomyces sp. ISL-10]|uniref:DUF6879 family protein n=1 Tax=Streptomyces sp. ISL-10 TaxID=2819172 RepID=UPI001BE9D217|nr:DUF6879 family protein [Streptomyces sp. ISL-10]MBT2364246.1 hypothetical protein [Streptomyces sp. ISL-10]
MASPKPVPSSGIAGSASAPYEPFGDAWANSAGPAAIGPSPACSTARGPWCDERREQTALGERFERVRIIDDPHTPGEQRTNLTRAGRDAPRVVW